MNKAAPQMMVMNGNHDSSQAQKQLEEGEEDEEEIKMEANA